MRSVMHINVHIVHKVGFNMGETMIEYDFRVCTTPRISPKCSFPEHIAHAVTPPIYFKIMSV